MPLTLPMPEPEKQVGENSREEKLHGLVRDFYEQRKSQESSAVARPKPLLRRPIVAVLALVACAGVWFVPPMLSRQAEAPSIESVERNAKLSIFLASLTVRDFIKRNGRAPGSLAEAGVDDKGLSYSRMSDSVFELGAQVGAATMSYLSTSDVKRFLGADSSLARIR
jgi:hypothetical protein